MLFRNLHSGDQIFQLHPEAPRSTDLEVVAWHAAINRIPDGSERTNAKQAILQFRDTSGAIEFLQQFATDPLSMTALRLCVFEEFPSLSDRRLSPDKILECVAHLLVTHRACFTTRLIAPREFVTASGEEPKKPPESSVPPLRVTPPRAPQSAPPESAAVPSAPNSPEATPEVVAQANTLTNAAQTGTPFCEVCEKAKREAEAAKAAGKPKTEPPSTPSQSGDKGPEGAASPSANTPVDTPQQSQSPNQPSSTPPSNQSPTPAPTDSPALSFYEVVVLDELETAIAGVEVELTTPNGTETLVTDGSGRVRVDDVPPGTGSAHIVSAQQLFDVLRDRVEQDTRRTPLPEGDDLLVLTPTQVETSVSFPDAKTQRIMIVNRTDVVWGSVAEHWGDLMLLSEETDPCRLIADAVTATLKLSSTGASPQALIGLPASGVQEDTDRNITGETIADQVDQKARLNLDIDALNEALFTANFDAVSKLIEPAADEPPPAPAPPDFPTPSEEGLDFAAELALLALQGNTDLLEDPGEQV